MSSMGYAGSPPWLSLGDFAGFRDNKREAFKDGKPREVAGLLAVPPPPSCANDDTRSEPARSEVRSVISTSTTPLGVARTAADRVREKLLALKSRSARGGSASTGRRPGIAEPPTSAAAPEALSQTAAACRTEASGQEHLVFRCTGPRCRHTWVSGRGATSFEQICKSCGASVVGVLSKAAVICEGNEGGSKDVGEVLRVAFDRNFGPAFTVEELEGRLRGFVEAELRFFGKFLAADGVESYVAYRRGQGNREVEGRDSKQDVILVDRLATTVESLCKAEFEGTMRGGEADAKLQALLDGHIALRFVAPLERLATGGSSVTLAVDFGASLDVEDHIADKVDERLQAFRKVQRELDKGLLEKSHDSGPARPLPRTLFARVIAGLDWQRALNSINGREGHDRLRCMTCRFLGEDCSTDVARSQDVRRALKQVAGFVFQSRVVLGRVDRGGKSWKERVAPLLEGVAETPGGECFILARASEDAADTLEVLMYSQPEWLGGATDRLCTVAHGGNAAPFLTNLVGLGRAAKGLHVIEPKVGMPPSYALVSDVVSFLDLFASKRLNIEDDDALTSTSSFARVLWTGVRPRTTFVQPRDLEKSRALFRLHSSFEDIEEFVDFLRDFRQGTAKALAKPEPRPPRPLGGFGSERSTPAPSRACSVAPSVVSRRSPSLYRSSCPNERSSERRSGDKRRRSSSSSSGSCRPNSRKRNEKRTRNRSRGGAGGCRIEPGGRQAEERRRSDVSVSRSRTPPPRSRSPSYGPVV
eukprot:TRINITY_DN26165_c0_g1_i1.p1 TRINITY_DN26165_c0_g1~~TRINITY_DN26165_c0_g1_i1.p1  ORF type:complete len:759 (-),score=107.43 TRINITY_DN26165_c0_g1_i1:60-2336(-)